MEGDSQKRKELPCKFSELLELSASDDVCGFRTAIEEDGHDIDEPGLWYGRLLGSKKMGLVARTPLMIAAMFGSRQVLKYILGTGLADANAASQSDGAAPLHCAVAGGSPFSAEILRALLDESADANFVDFNGNKPADLVSLSSIPVFNLRNRKLDAMLRRGDSFDGEDERNEELLVRQTSKNGSEKKEYPIDLSLPDIRNGIYGTDEFRMYTFKVKPCSRAYSHDWTECPFAHPGENARRRDPRKYHYSCVPCPEFRKGSCQQGDACEYAHGIFECWLHPAQYRTRLCKDETGCRRRVCFFAHKREELRPVCSSTGSAVLSPSSFNPLPLGSPSSLMSPTKGTMPSHGVSSPMGGGGAMWPNPSDMSPPALHLPGSRLKSALSARDMGLNIEELRLQQLLMNRSGWTNPLLGGGAFPGGEFSKLEPVGYPTAMNQSYPSGLSSPPVRPSSPFGPDPSRAGSAFPRRSQSFVERHEASRQSGLAANPSLLDWGSPDGKLDWGVQGDELNKLRRSGSFGFAGTGAAAVSMRAEEAPVNLESEQRGREQQYNLSSGGSQVLPLWLEQLYMEPEQTAA